MNFQWWVWRKYRNIFAHGTSDKPSPMVFAVEKADEDENLLLEKQDYFEAEVCRQHGWNLKLWKAGWHTWVLRIIALPGGISELPHPILTTQELEKRIQHNADMEQDY